LAKKKLVQDFWKKKLVWFRRFFYVKQFYVERNFFLAQKPLLFFMFADTSDEKAGELGKFWKVICRGYPTKKSSGFMYFDFKISMRFLCVFFSVYFFF
jgi:hypothetical protein